MQIIYLKHVLQNLGLYSREMPGFYEKILFQISDAEQYKEKLNYSPDD